VRLQQRRRGQHERDVVDGRREPGPVGALAGPVDAAGARVRAEPHGEEEPPVDVLRHGGRVLRARQASELRGVVGHEAGVVDRRQGRREDREVAVALVLAGGGGRRRVLVLEDAGDGGVVERALRVGVRPRLHVVDRAGVRRLGGEQDVAGLPRRDDEGVHGEGLDVERVDVDDGERVVGDGEEELVVECGVDEPEHVRLAGLHLQLERVLSGAVVERPRESVNGVGVGDVGSAAGLQRLRDHRLRVVPPPLAEHDGHLLVRRRERVRHAGGGQDDDGPVDGGAEPGDVRVPPQRAALPDDLVPVHVALAGLDRALRDVRGPVRPPAQQLPHAVPVDADVVGGAVDHVDLHVVALPREQRGTWVLSVHCHDALRAAQPRHAGHLHLPYIQIDFIITSKHVHVLQWILMKN